LGVGSNNEGLRLWARAEEGEGENCKEEDEERKEGEIVGVKAKKMMGDRKSCKKPMI